MIMLMNSISVEHNSIDMNAQCSEGFLFFQPKTKFIQVVMKMFMEKDWVVIFRIKITDFESTVNVFHVCLFVCFLFCFVGWGIVFFVFVLFLNS